jgi:hypothetical protein
MFIVITAPFALGFAIAALRARRPAGRGMAIAGLVLGILGTLGLIVVILVIIAAALSGPTRGS